MFDADDTIVAVATPPGRGAIGIVRLSGPTALRIAAALTVTPLSSILPRVARVTRVRSVDPAGVDTRDEAVVVAFPGPASYTGEDVVEISAHGNPVVLDGIVRAAMQAGARLAAPGEFTLRSFLNGKRDLPRAEAVADLIAATTPAQTRLAADQLQGTLTARIAAIDAELFDLLARLEASLDFPDEGYHFVGTGETAARIGDVRSQIDVLLASAARGRMLRDGATVVLTGRPNVGKSSLFNALLDADRAIVTDVPGTTRDLVSERVDIEGLAITLVDTAGVHAATDAVERAGVERSVRAQGGGDLLLVVLDQGEVATGDDRDVIAATSGRPRVLVKNKADREDRFGTLETTDRVVRVSAADGRGLDDLRSAIARALTGEERLRDTPAVANTRHVALLQEARTALNRACESASAGASEEFVAADLQQARAAFDDIVGARTSEDVLRHIFERFCIGK